jgi:signal transduction histidine kinase
LTIQLDGGSEGYLLVAGDEKRLTDPRCLQTLQGLGGHIRSAFIKGRLVRQLRELNQTKNEFLGIAAHDLRSPLGSVISFSGLLIKQLEQDRLERERAHRFLVNINTAATQMLSLVEDLLDVAAIESGRVELRLGRHNLADIVRERCALNEPAARSKGIALTAETAAAEHHVLVDRVRLGEVLDNLLGNSIKFTHSGGQVRVWCEDRGAEVAVHVADTGVGLADDELAKVFTGQRLSARPTGGESSTGLGLVIVRKLVEEHGGRIRVRSQRGVGTTFTLTLPFDDSDGPAEPTSATN